MGIIPNVSLTPLLDVPLRLMLRYLMGWVWGGVGWGGDNATRVSFSAI